MPDTGSRRRSTGCGVAPGSSRGPRPARRAGVHLRRADLTCDLEAEPRRPRTVTSDTITRRRAPAPTTYSSMMPKTRAHDHEHAAGGEGGPPCPGDHRGQAVPGPRRHGDGTARTSRDDRRGVGALQLRLGGEHETVREHRAGQRLDVVGHDVVAALRPRRRPGPPAAGSSVARGDMPSARPRMATARVGEVDQVRLQARRDVHEARRLRHRADVGRGRDRARCRRGCSARRACRGSRARRRDRGSRSATRMRNRSSWLSGRG